MADSNIRIFSGYLIDEQTRLTLRQICDACSVHAEFVIELVNEGVIEPTGYEKSHWCFSGYSLRRIRTAKHLKRDLGINLAGIGLALDLLDELDLLQSQLNQLSVFKHD
jgi:chaperone modulatory protein CbpM